uniref:Uncharacterized protein n=1 Tax=Corynebacterium glutamicum TaxID=1718 RepID=A0A142EAK9_CORGT|nr:Hypothetical protein [Corynebacterium glutamicum]
MNSPDLSQRRGPRKPPPAPDSAEVVTANPATAPEPEPTPEPEPAKAVEPEAETDPAPAPAEVVTSTPEPEPTPEPVRAEVVIPAPTPQVTTSIDGFAEWEPPAVVKLTTQITVEHRKLLHLLERQTGTSLWKLIGHAIDETYGKKD